MLNQPQKAGGPRRVVVMSALTKVARRELHHTYSSFKAACTVPDGDLKSTLDGVVLMGITGSRLLWKRGIRGLLSQNGGLSV